MVLAAFATVAIVGAGVVIAVAANADTTVSYEAEASANVLTGSARAANCPACSGHRKVGFVGNGGTLRFTGVVARAAGPATVHIAYATGTRRSAQLSVDGGSATTIDFPPTGGFGRPGGLDVTVTLAAGPNTLTFGNPSGWAPDFDRITLDAQPDPTPAPSGLPSGSPTATPTDSPTPTPTGDDAMTAQVVTLVNQERAKVGCAPLTVDSRLVAAAQGHSADMAARDYFDHTTPEGVTFDQRITQAGYRWSGAAENIAKGQPDAASVMAAWMNSPGHRANILNCGYRDIGVGLAYDASHTPLWTQDFGSPL